MKTATSSIARPKSWRQLASALLAGLVSFIVWLIIFVYFGSIATRNDEEALRGRTIENAATVRAVIEKNIYKYLGGLQLSQTAMLLEQHMDRDSIQAVGREVQRVLPAIRQLVLAPDGIVSLVYPETDADKVIGFDVLQRESTRETAREAMLSEKMLLAGPLPLVTGGIGLVARKPVFVQTETGDKRFWGFIIVVIDSAQFFSILDDEASLGGAQISIRGRDAKGVVGDVFYGSAKLFDDEYAAKASVELPGQGEWQLAVRLGQPEIGQVAVSRYIHLAMAIVAAFGLGVMVGLLRWHILDIRNYATIDLLTGALVRGEFYERANREWARARRAGLPCSLVAIDIDHFKKINDNYGHAAGDRVLTEFGEKIRGLMRAGDYFGRVGGEEFAILVSDTNVQGAYQLAERLREEIKAAPVPVNQQEISITASFGVATFEADGGDVAEVMARADKALYQAKAGGRDRSVIAQGA